MQTQTLQWAAIPRSDDTSGAILAPFPNFTGSPTLGT